MGRQALIMVVAYSLIFLLTGAMMSNATVDAFNNAMAYSDTGTLQNIAIAGANMAANYVFINKPGIAGNAWWNGWTTPISLAGGTFTVRMDSVQDMFGKWGRIQMTTTAYYGDSTYQVVVLFNPSQFSKFALYAGSMSGVYFEPSDSVFGPCHIESTLNYGNPAGGTQAYGAYFGGKVTTKSGIAALTNPAKLPTFAGGLQNGVSIPLSLNTAQLVAQAGGNIFNGGNLYLTLKDDSVSYSTSGWTTGVTTKAISQIAPNGVIAIDKGTLYVKGELSKPLTVASLRSSGSSGGTVTVKDNVTYKTDPRTDPNCSAMLGIVAYSTVMIDTTSHNNFTVQGSMYSQTDGVQVKNYSTRPRGELYVLGGWCGTQIYATSNGTTAGLPVNVTYDERFRVESPPYFPGTNTYQVLSWYE